MSSATNFLVFSFFVSVSFAQALQSQSQYESVPPEPGERCIICGVRLTEKDVTLVIRGRRVPLKAAMVDSFMKHPEKYFAELQPKSALFQENLEAPRGVAQGGISPGWFLFGLYILVALIFGGLSGNAAVSKGLRPIRYFFVGLFLSVFGYLYVLTRPAAANKGDIPKGLVKVPTTHAPIACPKCGNPNHPSATTCLACGAKTRPTYASEISRAN